MGSSVAGLHLRAIRHRVLHVDVGDADGRLLVIRSDPGGFGQYLAEVLRAEGLTSFAMASLPDLTDERLRRHDAVLLDAVELGPAQVATLERFVAAGGGVVALRPDPRLGPLLGLRCHGDPITDGYLRATSPDRGVTERAMQIHGSASRCTLEGAIEVAHLLDPDGRPTGCPAVTVHHRTGAGVVAAFAYDLARSLVLTRQGNPAWVGQRRDGDLVVRSNDLFYGAAADDPQPDWVDPDLLDLPQADEQQRLLVSLLQEVSDARPHGLTWYLPRGSRATVVMTGDDHGGNGTSARFDDYASVDGTGVGWDRVRATSYLVVDAPLDDATAAELVAKGFEISVHVVLHRDHFTPGSLHRALRRQLRAFRRRFPSIPAPVTHRTHAVPWCDWSSHAEAERAHGIRLDANYYFYPGTWVRDRPGLFTGSGLPMRFATTRGEVVDCYQLVTQLTDEAAQTYPRTIEALLDAALGDPGHPLVLGANMHTDLAGSNGSDAIVAAARARGVPVVSAAQLLAWLDGRGRSSVRVRERTAATITLDVHVDADAEGLVAMVPLDPAGEAASGVSVAGRAIEHWHQDHAGRRYVAFPAETGVVEVACGPEPAPRRSTPLPAALGARSGAALVHASVADFASGTLDGARVSGRHDGCVILAPYLGLEPRVDAVPVGPGWTLGTGEAGTADGALRIEAGGQVTSQPLTPGRAIETEVVLGAVSGRVVGLVGDDGTEITFRTVAGGELQMALRGPDLAASTALPGRWSGEAHRLRIDWRPGLVTFLVDGQPRAQHRTPMGGSLRPWLAAGPEAPMDVCWVRCSPFERAGVLTSAVLDAGREVWWGRAMIVAPATSMTAARIEVRTGATPEPGPGWAPFHEPGLTGGPVDQLGRYAQYRLRLSGGSDVTPEVREVRLELGDPR